MPDRRSGRDKDVSATSKLALFVMGLGMACWVWAGLSWYRANRYADTEQSQTPRVGNVEVDLSDEGEWQAASFSPNRIGSHEIVLESTAPRGQSDEIMFQGVLEVEVTDPEGEELWHKQLRVDHKLGPRLSSTVLGDLRVDYESVRGMWTLRARVLQGDRQFSGVASSVYLQTPSLIDVPQYLLERFSDAVVVSVMGIIFMIIGTSLWKRSRERL